MSIDRTDEVDRDEDDRVIAALVAMLLPTLMEEVNFDG